VLKIAQEVERAIADKTSRKQRRKHATVAEIKEQEVEVLENVSSDSDSDCIVVQPRKSI
jgi:NAD+--asparagine ADP-ribosyltransferase